MVICFFSTQYLPTPGGRAVHIGIWRGGALPPVTGRLLLRRHFLGLPARQTDADGIEIFRLPVWPVMSGRLPVLKPSLPPMRCGRRTH